MPISDNVHIMTSDEKLWLERAAENRAVRILSNDYLKEYYGDLFQFFLVCAPWARSNEGERHAKARDALHKFKELIERIDRHG